MFDVKIHEEKIIVTSLVNKKIDATLYTKTPWDDVPRYSIKHSFNFIGDIAVFPVISNEWSEVCVYENKNLHSFILPIRTLNKKREKIICVGLNKTGTTSLKKGLEDLGFRGSPEYIGHQRQAIDVVYGSMGSTISAIENPKYDFYEDMPYSFPKVYENIFKHFPNEKYVLTVRNDVDEFVNSCLKFYKETLKNKYLNGFDNRYPYINERCDGQVLNTYNWGYPMFKAWGIDSVENIEEKLRNTYLRHTKDFVEFMEDNGGDYLIINVARKNELKKLADWLGVETELNNFEHLNKTNLNRTILR